MRLRCAAVLFAVAAAAAAGHVQALRPDGADGSAALYRVDAIITDARGAPVEDLKSTDFQIVEGGAARAVEAARFVTARRPTDVTEPTPPIRSQTDEQGEATQDGARLFAIFLDEYHVTPGEGARAVSRLLIDLIQQRLGSRDLLIVVRPLDSLVDLRLGHDVDAAVRVIRGFEGRKGNYTPRNAFESNYIAANPARIEAVRTQIVTSALNALAVHLGALSTGRKTIIFVSEGFPPAARRRGDEPLPTLDAVVRSANRGGVSIYPWDPQSLQPSAPASVATAPLAGQPIDAERAAHDLLRSLAEETAGFAVLTAADVGEGSRRIIGDASAYYVITFRAAHGDDIGAFHAVELRVAREGAIVLARKGYWTPSADEVLRARMAAKAAEPRPPPDPPLHASPLIRPWFGVARASGGKVRVSFVWEPAGRVPGDRTRAQPPARIALKATRSGAVLFEGAVGPSEGRGDEAAGGSPSEIEFDVAPGRMRVQMTIEDGSARRLDTDVRDVIVGSLGGSVALGTPQVLRARNAREYRDLKENFDAAPIAAREFSRTERLLVRVPAYADGASLRVTSRLLGARGSAMREVKVDPGPGGMYQADLPLAGLAPGEYILELLAVGRDAQSKDALRFRVTS